MLTLSEKNWFLEGYLDDGQPWIIPINKNSFIIGRRDDCDLTLLSKNVSRRHAEIYFSANKIYINDLKSTNGTFVNSTRINTATILNDGDTLHFSDMKFKVILKDANIIDGRSGTYLIKRPEKTDTFIGYFGLSKREEEILYNILEGKSTKAVADLLFISEGTAKNHVLNIFKKVDVHSRFELLALYNNFKDKK